MPFLKDIFNPELFSQMRDQGYIRIQYHPVYPYAIANYTDRAQYAREWNPVTMQCRGLIYRTDTQEIVARPFPKFFNYEELTNRGVAFDLNFFVRVTDKIDGSLGIVYPTPEDGWAVATRGSFTSEQAIKATAMLQEYIGRFGVRFDRDLTDLVEIIYPLNRIVVDYGGAEKLVWIGCVDNQTGTSYQDTFSMPLNWPSEHVRQEFGATTLSEALALPPRPNAEGIVIHFVASDQRIKVKQEDYVRLHRIVTGLNARAVWEAMREDRFEALRANVPEEFLSWLDDVYRELSEQYRAKADDMTRLFIHARTRNEDRKSFAIYVMHNYDNKRTASYMFALLDGRDIEPMIWDDIRPSADWTLHDHASDAAA